MWNESAQGGGFFNSPQQFAAGTTPNANANAKAGRRTSHTAPLVIKQALHCGDEGVSIYGTSIQIVNIVAIVRNIRMQSTKIIYTIQDMTGRMQAVLWVDQDSQDEDEKATPKIDVNTYVQIFGNVKMNRGNKQLMVFKISPIKDINAITAHYLQCLNNKLKLEAESKKVVESNPSFGNGLPSNSMVGASASGGGAAAAGLNPRQTLVFNLIRASAIEQGTSKADMFQTLKDRMTQMELDNILEWMCGEGHIYSTIDEDHFRATDAY